MEAVSRASARIAQRFPRSISSRKSSPCETPHISPFFVHDDRKSRKKAPRTGHGTVAGRYPVRQLWGSGADATNWVGGFGEGVGLVASATHLGNPANALYVFMGVGRSPLSNEVFSAVIFLAFSGVYWLYSFAVKPHRLLQRLLAVGACASAIACITAIAFAYSASTIVTWDTPFSPLSLWTNALLGGPVLAIVGLRAARWKSRGNRFGRLMLALAVVALAACLVVYALQGAIVLPAENAVASAGDLVPHYALLVCVFATFAAAGIAVDALSLFRPSVSREGKVSPDEMTISVSRASVAALLVLAGIFVMRFSFYMMHMTVGISF